ncbi:hypothetical protein CDAR_521501 [Caerostris darwini]|uniref:Uncharacterized protein n=1 Tax=Caerostris darwini TaxID=1538125 RepID=A0AAV4RT09_9ARAC|nr:hypothetical protein CDAR_521501 [Caerostris darwini]
MSRKEGIELATINAYVICHNSGKALFIDHLSTPCLENRNTYQTFFGSRVFPAIKAVNVFWEEPLRHSPTQECWKGQKILPPHLPKVTLAGAGEGLVAPQGKEDVTIESQFCWRTCFSKLVKAPSLMTAPLSSQSTGSSRDS